MQAHKATATPTHHDCTDHRGTPVLMTATVLLPTELRQELKLRIVPGLAAIDPPVVGPKEGVNVATTAVVMPEELEQVNWEEGKRAQDDGTVYVSRGVGIYCRTCSGTLGLANGPLVALCWSCGCLCGRCCKGLPV